MRDAENGENDRGVEQREGGREREGEITGCRGGNGGRMRMREMFRWRGDTRGQYCVVHGSNSLVVFKLGTMSGGWWGRGGTGTGSG